MCCAAVWEFRGSRFRVWGFRHEGLGVWCLGVQGLGWKGFGQRFQLQGFLGFEDLGASTHLEGPVDFVSNT